jgi:hypothetical protein
MEQQQQPFELPQLRTFVVRLQPGHDVREITVQAHSWSPIGDNGASFQTFVLKDGIPYERTRRALWNVADVEDITPIPVDVPVSASKIIH